MSETDRLTDEEKERQGVLLKARQALMVILGYQPAGSEEESAKIEASYLSLVERNPWLVKPEERFRSRGDYRTVTPLSLLREQLEREYGWDS